MGRGPKDYLDRATSTDATSEELRELASSEYSFVRLAVARHPATPPVVLVSLVPDRIERYNDAEVALALARNGAFPPSELHRIAMLVPPALHVRDMQLAFEAGVALFERADTPDTVLTELLSDESTTAEFRKVAARQTTHEEVKELLADDASDRVRRSARRARPSDP